jgi:hypothetical protein
MTFPDGSVYNGEYKNGKQHGSGTIIFKDESIYSGTFVDGMLSGTGYLLHKDGTVEDCLWGPRGRLRGCLLSYTVGKLEGKAAATEAAASGGGTSATAATDEEA